VFFSQVDPLITAEQLQLRIKQLGFQLTKRYAQDPDLLVICILKGAVLFLSDLVREMDLPLEMDFVMLSSYHGGTTSGQMEVLQGVSSEVANRPVLIIEDIVDTGRTILKMKELLAQSKPKSIEVCALLDKPSRRVVPMQPEYIGFTIDDLFVVGYGLDYEQRYRNLPYIGVLVAP
jgi:hypoxanthine phosphoribosyltransferase